MASESPKKKRITLQSIVEKLVERADTQDHAVSLSKQGEESVFSPKPAVPVRPYLLPLTPSSGPASPAISEDLESLDEEGQSENRGPVMQDEREETRKEGICREPMRCEVCGLRVFKSYRYISRTNAPLHLKNFVSSNVDRVRVCKRCFSSRERCRQNLALILLRSKTSQMMHLRTPLGVTYNRATKAMDHIAHDLRKGLKRPYDDLLCDETMADEEEMEVDDERFLWNGEVKTSGPTKPRVFVTENKGIQDSQFKDIGLVTVVRHQNGAYSSISNCFTQYGDVNDVKFDKKTIEREQNGNGPQIDATENLRKLVDQTFVVAPTVSKNASSEIHSINNKLTMLDHPYALQLPNESSSSLVKSPSVIKPVKQPDIKMGKVSSTVRPEQIKKSVNQDGKMTSERTCGIICYLCDQLVTKSYSCYKKENAPEKIKHLFTPAMKVVKVCRRCLPYKKPKDDENTDSAGKSKCKMKIIKGKLVKIHSAKLVKNAKTSGRVKPVNVSEKIKDLSSEKSALKLPSKEDPKKKKDDKTKTIPAKKVCSTVAQTLKTPGCKGAVAKDVKVGSSKNLQTDTESNAIAKESGNGKTNSSKGNTKLSYSPPKMGGQRVEEAVKSGTKVEKTAISTVEKENVMDSNHKSTTKVDSGTQSMKSMIGVRSKGKLSNITMTSENKDKKGVATSIEDRIPSNEENMVNTETDSQKEVNELGMKDDSHSPDRTSQEGSKVHSQGENSIEKTEGDFEGKAIKLNMEDQSKQTEKDETKGSKDNQEGILNMRERRSTSKSPVRVKETKPAEVLSPRRTKTPGTPEKRREDKQVTPTIMTRKRMASFCESESEKKVDGESSNDNLPAPKRRAVAALLEKMSRKTVVSSTSPKDSSSDQEQEASKPRERASDKKVGGHCMTRRNQAPVLCAKCSEQVVKSYRCILRAQSPAHIKPLFAKQKGDMLRVCRKCVKKPLTMQDTS